MDIRVAAELEPIVNDPDQRIVDVKAPALRVGVLEQMDLRSEGTIPIHLDLGIKHAVLGDRAVVVERQYTESYQVCPLASGQRRTDAGRNLLVEFGGHSANLETLPTC